MLAIDYLRAFMAVLTSSPTHSSQPSTSDDPTLCKLPSDPSIHLGEGFGATKYPFVTSTGALNTSMIFVDFPDAPANDTPQSLHAMFAPGAPDWYRTASFGALTLEIAVPEWSFYRMPCPSHSYGFERGLTWETHVKYINDALSAVGPNVSFAGIEVLYIVPTTAAKAIAFSPTCMVPVTAADGTSIPKTVTFGQDVPRAWGCKTMNHETGHAMGLPDLYPLDGKNGRDTTRWTGGSDMMGLISGVAPDFGAWHKWKLGWLGDERVACVAATSRGRRVFRLEPLEVAGEVGSKAVAVVHNETAALVAEARTTYGGDANVCAEGMLIYVVYTNVESGEGQIRVFDSRPGSGGCSGGELNDAPYDNATLTSEEFGVSIAVGAREGDTWTVTVSKQ